MNNKYSEETKKAAIKMNDCGERVAEIVKKLNVPRTTIYRWISDHEKEKSNHNQIVLALEDRHYC